MGIKSDSWKRARLGRLAPTSFAAALLIGLGALPAEAAGPCAPRHEKSGALCYPKCRKGYKGVGPVCWQRCPKGFRNDGAFCAKPKAYGRGTGYPWKFGDKPFSLKAARRRCERKHGKCQKWGAIYYPRCRSGFHPVGCCVCSPNCLRGMKDIGVSCAKKSYGRGVGFLSRSAYRGIFYRYIRDHRNIHKRWAKSLRAAEKTYLKRFFPARLVDGMKVVELLGMTGAFSHKAAATTYGRDFIIIRKGKRSNGLLQHEFVHACQYDRLGVRGFARAYADQYVDGGYDYASIKFEREAFDYQRKPDASTPRIEAYLGYCN